MISTASARDIRRQCFARPLPLNSKLSELCAETPSHAFLVNPASQNTYLYLAEYIKLFSEQWFQKRLGTLKLLDWGTGKGHMTYLLQEQDASVTSCDIDDQSNDSAFGQPTPIIAKCGIPILPLRHEFLLPFANDSFDVVLSVGVLEHVPNEEKSLNELHRVLRPGGLFFCFYLPQRFSWTQQIARLKGDNYHDRLYTPSLVTELLKNAGFRPLDIWQRALFPKNTVRYRNYRSAETWDQKLCAGTPLRHLATNLEFVAVKPTT